MDVYKVRAKLNDRLAEVRLAKEYVAQYELDKVFIEGNISKYEAVQQVFQTATKLMYANLSSRLGDIISEGLAQVFPESGYTFMIEFVERRNTIEADLFFMDADGERYDDPLDDVGGGVVDFSSILLRIAYILLSKYRNFIVADEPLKFVDIDRVPLAAEFIKRLCEDVGMKLLVVTHIPAIAQRASTLYEVKKRLGISSVTEIKQKGV